MPNNNESTMKWKVDISQLKAAMQDAKRSITLANAEFKAATAGMDRWSKSTQGLEAKLKQLNSTLPQQKTILAQLEKQYELVCQNQGESSAEAQKLKIQIENQKGAINKTEAAIDKYNGQLTQMQKEEKESSSELSKLTKTIEAQEKRLESLKKEYKNAVLQYGENSDEAKALAKQIQKLSGELKDNKQKLADADKAAENLDESFEEVDDSAKDAAKGGFTVLKGAMADLVSKGIQKVIEGLKNLTKYAGEAWKAFDEGSDIITKKTGATGAAAKDLEKAYKDVSKKVVGSYEEIGTAVGEVSTRFGVSGKELEDLSVKFLKFAKLNGTDVSGSIDSVQSAMSAWGLSAEDAGDMLDVLNKVGQDTGTSVDALADAMKTNAPALQEMGFSAADAADFIGKMDKSGIDASSTLGGLKKALLNAAKEGKPMDKAMQDMEKSIKDAATETDAINIAAGIFGKSAAPAIAQAVRDGRLSFDDMGKSLTDFNGNIETTYDATQDASDNFALAMQGVKTDVAGMVGDLLEKYAPEITAAIDGIKGIVSGFFDTVSGVIDWIIEHGDLVVTVVTAIVTAVTSYLVITKAVAAAQALLNAVMSASPIGLIIAGITALVAAFVTLWNKSEAFREFWIGLWDKIKTIVETVWKAITGFFTNAWNKIKEVWGAVTGWFKSKIIDPIKNFFSGMWDGLKNGAKAAWEGIKSVFKPVADWFKNIFSKAWAAVKKVFSTGGKIFEGIKDGIVKAFKAVVNAIIRGINKVIAIPFNAINWVLEKIRSVSILGIEPFSWISTFSVPQIPELRRGGVLKRGQMGLLEGDGAEAVVPLDQNKKWIAAVVNDMLSEMGVPKGAGGAGAMSNGSMTQNVTFNQTINSPKAVDRLTIYRETNSLLFSAKVGLSNV